MNTNEMLLNVEEEIYDEDLYCDFSQTTTQHSRPKIT